MLIMPQQGQQCPMGNQAFLVSSLKAVEGVFLFGELESWARSIVITFGKLNSREHRQDKQMDNDEKI